MTAMLELPTRPMTDSDRRFVVPTWAGTARYGLSTDEQFRMVDALLDRRVAQVSVFATNECTVHAWLATDGERVMHYLYVAPELWSSGLAQALMLKQFGKRGPSIVTHKTKLAPHARYVPHLLTLGVIS